MQTNAGSYRDPAGFVFSLNGKVYRQINLQGQIDFDAATEAGLYKELIDNGWLVKHREVDAGKLKLPADKQRYKIIQPTQIPFISYPYEWSFEQLKDAALLTLQIEKAALKKGFILKDASSYNIQFIGKQPVFIDTLSFAKKREGQGWEGYKQFCEHFLGPLALAHYAGDDILKGLQTYIEGYPLALTTKLLPRRARFKKGLMAHVYLHATSQRRHEGDDTPATTKTPKVSDFALQGLVDSLLRSVKALQPNGGQTEWGEYYTFTNYSEAANKSKEKLVKDLLQQVPKPKLVWDVGANDGRFSRLALDTGAYVIAWDIDSKAVQANYRHHVNDDDQQRMLPLLQDLVAPSANVGWRLKERESLVDRGPADVTLALALIHHLAIGRNVPLPEIAAMFAELTKQLIIEFVPKGDSKVEHLLASRPDIFPNYDSEHFEVAFNQHFKLIAKKPVKDSKRWLYLYAVKHANQSKKS